MNRPDAPAAPDLQLTSAQAQAWDQDGFIVLERFVDEATLAELRRAYDDVLTHAVEAAGDRMLGNITRQVMSPRTAHPLFASNDAIDRGIHFAAQLFGTDQVVMWFDMLIYKAPGHPHETPWHQDMGYTSQPFAPPGTTILSESIQFWLPLDDVDVENGCMQFVPGHHTLPLLEHYVASGDPSNEGRLLALVDPVAQLDLSTRVVAEIPAGGVTMHSFGTPHYTGPNYSATRQRRAYIFNVATARTRKLMIENEA